jgi:carbon-monoxide dehydrogenase medium subunit
MQKPAVPPLSRCRRPGQDDEEPVKPALFDYHAPRELNEALRILGDAGADGRVLAGGQSLMPMLNLRILSPAVLVDINRVAGLDQLRVDGDTLVVGALVRHADLLRSTDVRQGWPLLWEATTQVAHMAIRNRGTVCGSVCHNDPSAEHPSVLVTMRGTVVVAGGTGRRELPAEEFFTGMLSNALEPGEMVVELRYPKQPAGAGTGFVEFARRLGDFAIAGAAAMLTVRDDVCEEARLTVVGMGEGPIRARFVEDALKGKLLDAASAPAAFAEAAERVRGAVEPHEDVHASSGYRRHLAGVMAEQALAKALARAGGQHLG